MNNTNKNEVLNSNEQTQVPQEYYCPITQEIMFNPVLASDGHTYEREAIETYMKKNTTSPLTRELLTQQLTPIHFLRSSIRQFLDNNPSFWKEVYLSSQLIAQFITAIQQNNVKQVEEYLEDKRFLEKPLQGISLLEWICQQTNTQLLQTVIEHLQRSNLFQPKHDEVIHYLALCAKSMGIAGIQIVANACGWQAENYYAYVEWCIQQGNLPSVKALLTLPTLYHKADKEQNKTLLHVAARSDNEAIVSLLLEHKLEIDAVDNKGNTALHIAAQYNKATIAQLLIEQGASVELRNNMQECPSDVARTASHQILAKQIEQWHQEQKLKPLLAPLKEMLLQEQQARKKLEQTAARLYPFFKANLQNFLTTSDTSTKPIKSLNENSNAVIYALMPLPNGELAIGSEERTVKIWNVKTGECVKVLKKHKSSVRALTVLSNGALASGSTDNTVKVWDMETGLYIKKLKGHKGPISALTVLPSAKLISGSEDTTIKLWDIKTGQCAGTLSGHTTRVTSLVVLPSGEVVSSAWDRTLKVWDINTGTCVKTLMGHNHYVMSLLLLPSGEVASGAWDNTLKVWDIKSGQCNKTLHVEGGITTFTLLANGTLASSSEDGAIKVWDMKLGTCVKTLWGHTGPVAALAALPSGELVSGSKDKTVKVWDVESFDKGLKDLEEIEQTMTNCKTM